MLPTDVAHSVCLSACRRGDAAIGSTRQRAAAAATGAGAGASGAATAAAADRLRRSRGGRLASPRSAARRSPPRRVCRSVSSRSTESTLSSRDAHVHGRRNDRFNAISRNDDVRQSTATAADAAAAAAIVTMATQLLFRTVVYAYVQATRDLLTRSLT